MPLILALWAIVIGYTVLYLGLDKLSSSPQNYSFAQVFFPQFLGARITKGSDGGGGGGGSFNQGDPMNPNTPGNIAGQATKAATSIAARAFQRASSLFPRPGGL